MADLGEGPGEGPRPLFLDQTEARTLENNFLGLPPLFRGLDDRPPLYQDLDPALLYNGIF